MDAALAYEVASKVANAATVCFGAAAVAARAPPACGPRFCTRHSLPGPGAIATFTRAPRILGRLLAGRQRAQAHPAVADDVEERAVRTAHRH